MKRLLFLPYSLLLAAIAASAAQADDFFAICEDDFAVVAERPLFFDDLREEAASLRDKWYAGCLAALGEQPLDASRGADEAYRLFWLDGSRRAVMLRAEQTAEGHRLVRREARARPGQGEPTPVEGRTNRLSSEEWQELTALLSSMSFWELPSKEELCLRCSGGTIWVLEGYRKGRYHVLHRRAPWDLEAPVRATGLYLGELSGLEPFAGKAG